MKKDFLKIMTMGLSCLFLYSNPSLAVLQDSRNINTSKIQEIKTFDDLPVGTIIPWSSSSPIPRQKWLPCDGQSVPSGGEYALLRAIIGGTTPQYNNAPNDNMYGVFLRGSRAPRLGKINADTTEQHTHEQKPHTHKFNLEVANNYLEGETLSAKYQDGKRGWNPWTNQIDDKIWGVWSSLLPRSAIANEIRNQPSDMGDWGYKAEGWKPGETVFEKDFRQVRENKIIRELETRVPYGSRISIDSMNYSTEATVIVSGYKGGEPHRTVIGKRWVPEVCDKEGNCSGGYYVDIPGTVTCSGASFTATQSVNIKNTTVDDPDFLLRTHPSSNFLGTQVDKDYSRIASWSIYGLEDTMDDSKLNGVRLTQKTVIGQLNEDGGDDSGDGINREDGQETMPANVTVRYIIKALP